MSSELAELPEDDDAPNRVQEPASPGGLFDFPDASGKDWSKEADKDKKPEPKKEPKQRGRPPGQTQKTKVKRMLGKQFVMMGVLASKFNEYDGQVILAQAEALTEETMKVAEESPWLMDQLESLTTTSLYGSLILVYAGVVLPIMANHGYVPELVVNFFDVPDLPDTED